MFVWTLLACGPGLTPYTASLATEGGPPAVVTSSGPTDPSKPPTDGVGAPTPPTAPTGSRDTTTPTEAPPELLALVSADLTSGAFPLSVTFDPSTSSLGSGDVRFTWDFGDGGASIDEVPVHTYVGEGTFAATLTLTDVATGEESVASVTIDVARPACPSVATSVALGEVTDGSISELSGIVASRVEPDVYWVHQDSGNDPVLYALDAAGAVLSEHAVDGDFPDFEDLAAATDPETGEPLLFLGDIGDNGSSRDEIAVWVATEPDPHADGDAQAFRMGLTYPDGAHNAETLLVDPRTLDVYVVTKGEGPASVYVKRAPHLEGGPYELEAVGSSAALPTVATGGDVSFDGSRIVVRDYTTTARLFFRDGYLPFEEAFATQGCPVSVAAEQQGEAIGFTLGDAGLISVSEGSDQPLNYVEL